MAKSLPLYKRIKERMRADLVAGHSNGSVARLPAERDLQLRYGVSRPTISKALGELATEGLVHRSPGSGSFLLPQPPSPTLFAPPSPPRIGYVAPIPGAELTQRSLRGIERAAQRRGYRVIFGNAGMRVVDEQAAVRDMIAAGARGLVIGPVTRDEEELADDYLCGPPVGVPVVLIDTALPQHPYPKVVFDNWRLAYDMTRWLLRRGHRRIAILSLLERTHHATLVPRLQGYHDALREQLSPPDPALLGRYDPQHPAEEIPGLLDRWLSLQEPPTAIIAIEDACAMELIDQLLLRGVRVPDQVQVVGFDHLEAARRFRPHFPTTNPDFVRMGEIACELLLRAIESGECAPPVYMLEASLLTHRGATGTPAPTAARPLQLTPTGVL